MIVTKTKRPRNVDAPRAAAILYGDWGTSKAYVIGLAFAVAGIQLVLAHPGHVRLDGAGRYQLHGHLPALPDGGGVYASVRHRSEVISIVGAFLLIADYIVTAAISALSAFQYLGWPHPELCGSCRDFLHRRRELLWAQTFRRLGFSGFYSDGDRGGSSRLFCACRISASGGKRAATTREIGCKTGTDSFRWC